MYNVTVVRIPLSKTLLWEVWDYWHFSTSKWLKKINVNKKYRFFNILQFRSVSRFRVPVLMRFQNCVFVKQSNISTGTFCSRFVSRSESCKTRCLWWISMTSSDNQQCEVHCRNRQVFYILEHFSKQATNKNKRKYNLHSEYP